MVAIDRDESEHLVVEVSEPHREVFPDFLRYRGEVSVAPRRTRCAST
jgi:hypothetical protein